MVALIVTVVAAIAFLALLDSVLPSSRATWMVRSARAFRALVRRARGERKPPPDPFVVLRVQSRLGILAEEIRRLESDPDGYAKVRRLEALNAAYDDLLEEGCRLAGITATPPEEDRPARRWREERELAEHGWSW
jgi:hypothetical protein